MRAFLFALLFLAMGARADDDLFTGIPPEKVAPDVRSFLATLTNALNSGEPNTVLYYAVTPETTGSGIYALRQRLGGLSKDRKVKKIELLPSVADADVEDLRNGVKYRPAAKPTHTVVARLEGAGGDVALIELPAAKVKNPNTNAEMWRLMAPAPVLPAGESARLAEAKAIAEKTPDVPRPLCDLGMLHALLGQRKEAEAVATRLAALADGKAKNQASYIHTQIGWIRTQLGDSKTALEAFQKGVELAPANASAAELGLAVGYYGTGEFASALRHFDHAAGQTPLYSDREGLEKYLLNNQTVDRSAVLAVQALWLKAFVPPAPPQR